MEAISIKALNLVMVSQPDEMTEKAFTLARIEKSWAVFTANDVYEFITDINSMIKSGEADEEIVEKAKKDISKLTPKIIIDSIGRKKTVYVKTLDSTDPEDKHGEAVERHKHNMSVQKMGKEASLRNIEKTYGAKIAEHVRSKHDEVISTGKKDAHEPMHKKEKREGEAGDVVFVTVDRKRISVDKTSESVIKEYVKEADIEQKDVEAFKRDFVSYMNSYEDITEKTASRVFHRWLKDGDDEIVIGSGSDAGYQKYYMSEIVPEMKSTYKREKRISESDTDKTKEVHVGDFAVLYHSSGRKMKVKISSETQDGKFNVIPIGDKDFPTGRTVMTVRKDKVVSMKTA